MPTFQNNSSDLPEEPRAESLVTLFESTGVKIERIVSRGQASPKDFWYDQDGDEWVMVLKGEAVVEFADGSMVPMKTGDHLLIPKRTRHRVERTSKETVWLAVHVKG